jgi:hypothetical protein
LLQIVLSQLDSTRLNVWTMFDFLITVLSLHNLQINSFIIAEPSTYGKIHSLTNLQKWGFPEW